MLRYSSRIVSTTLRLNVSVNSGAAVEKGTSHPRKGQLVPSYVISGLQGKKAERRRRENQVPTGFFCEQIVFKVEEAAQLSGRSIRHKVKNLVSQAALVLKDVQVCKRYPW